MISRVTGSAVTERQARRPTGGGMTTVALRCGDKVATALTGGGHAVVTSRTTSSGIFMIKATGLPTARAVASVALSVGRQMTI